jgi:hypothetical protein
MSPIGVFDCFLEEIDGVILEDDGVGKKGTAFRNVLTCCYLSSAFFSSNVKMIEDSLLRHTLDIPH